MRVKGITYRFSRELYQPWSKQTEQADTPGETNLRNKVHVFIGIQISKILELGEDLSFSRMNLMISQVMTNATTLWADFSCIFFFVVVHNDSTW